MAPIIWGVKTCALGRQRPFSPSVPAEAGCLFAVAACVHEFISGESLHCFLAGANKGYVIATSDLWLFIHASNLLPSLPTPLPYTNINYYSNVCEVTGISSQNKAWTKLFNQNYFYYMLVHSSLQYLYQTLHSVFWHVSKLCISSYCDENPEHRPAVLGNSQDRIGSERCYSPECTVYMDFYFIHLFCAGPTPHS